MQINAKNVSATCITNCRKVSSFAGPQLTDYHLQIAAKGAERKRAVPSAVAEAPPSYCID